MQTRTPATPPTAGSDTAAVGVDRSPVARNAELTEIADRAVDTSRRWLRIASGLQVEDPSADRLAAVLGDEGGVDFTVGFVDRVIRTEDPRAAGAALVDIAGSAPASLPVLDRAQIRTGAALAPVIPQVVVPAARARMRQMLSHMIVDARPGPFGRAVASLRADGSKLNVNLLGEAVLGETEAAHHTEQVQRLLQRGDVDYVSVKVSSIASQIDLWAFEESTDMVCERLRPLLRFAAAQPAGTAFVNLDMEEYQDLELTMAVFTRLLSEPELLHYEAGIVIQAYLPDALSAVQRLSAFAAARVARGGAGIKIRLVKGANLPMEQVHGELAGWPVTVCPSKEDTDANYKRVLDWVLRREHLDGLRMGIASHNIFDIAFAHELTRARGVDDSVEFEMLQGMARAEAAAIGRDVGDIRLYVPAVHPDHFDAAVSYLVRRLDENSSPENFMSGITELRNGNHIFQREEARFRASVASLTDTIAADDDTPPAPRRTQDRVAEAAAVRTASSEPPPLPGEFRNEPDTDPALASNRRWWEEHRDSDGGAALHATHLTDSDEVDAVVGRARAASAGWRDAGAEHRGRMLLRAADIMGARRGEFLSVMADEVGKTPDQSDPEVSEAIDFLRYYALRAQDLDRVEGAEFAPDSVVLITPPWNFPVAIPTGSTVAALAAGASAIHKPSSPTPRCSALIIECLHQAGVPEDVLQLVTTDEREVGRALVSHPHVDRVILTGSSETASLFRSFRTDLQIAAETSGKNALVITPSADRDLAVADLVTSAFGHAGQKCSAASLAILVGSTADSQRFRDQLVDAASSLIVGWPTVGPDGAQRTHSHAASMGPLTVDPEDKLLQALTTLEPGEEWLLEPERLDDTGRLWSPGIKTGVAPGSHFHLTEVFGPVLGIMRASSLEEAIDMQNAVDFGLTGGIHSLDAAEVETWLDRVEAGNVYVNRGITGAIVQRQPFGGWKKSSVGLGSKAGGPRYLMQFGTWHDAGPADPGAWLAAAKESDRDGWESMRPADPTGLESEANILRVLPRAVTIRVTEAVAPQVLERLAHAATTAGAPLGWSLAPVAAGTAPSAAEVVVEDADAFAARVAAGEIDDTVGARVRVVGAVEDALRRTTQERPEVAILEGPVTGSGEVELRHYVHEQAVSMTLHRFGTASRSFHALADRLRG
ncbi:proline dehydrogenase family protein [Brevibacterium jeotgali]|uniref:L-glutamate gamma-semialdehyde dehydrogenase n=1 Tax=Brevibacterium jeotgali TaxID=1262550 RepID=A0A2H1L1F1_9MICO|nr:bifunctional proline dehydrogenase/L-glutamate gamma-semialdehyde dehydrogenase [Brevibacterium jeotgali]TWC01947.1 L-proline dehydrogenase [Brevibacterium jeotgali]SMY10702.1 L-proline dehydrogenase [Brevibacterium jeotgali]